MTQIKTKIFNYGNEKESEWPTKYGTLERGVFHVDKETGETVAGYPPNPNPQHGTSAIVIFDSMPATYHEAACRTIESRKEWELADKQTGSITFGSKRDLSPKVDGAYERKRKKAELRKASKTALDVYKANPKELRQKLEKRAQAQVETLKKSGLETQLKDMGVKYE